MKRRLKKMLSLNKKHCKKNSAEVNCIHCGLGYSIAKRKTRNDTSRS